jgi:hypothetical protein
MVSRDFTAANATMNGAFYFCFFGGSGLPLINLSVAVDMYLVRARLSSAQLGSDRLSSAPISARRLCLRTDIFMVFMRSYL